MHDDQVAAVSFLIGERVRQCLDNDLRACFVSEEEEQYPLDHSWARVKDRSATTWIEDNRHMTYEEALVAWKKRVEELGPLSHLGLPALEWTESQGIGTGSNITYIVRTTDSYTEPLVEPQMTESDTSPPPA